MIYRQIVSLLALSHGRRISPSVPGFAAGLDQETASIYESILKSGENREFLELVTAQRSDRAKLDCKLGIVPGAFYRDHKHTGADGGRLFEIARTLGMDAELIPVRSFGRLAENGKIISEWVANQSESLLLASLSKGSADLKEAIRLGLGRTFTDKILCWVSLSGILQGTPLVQWLRNRPLHLFGVKLLLWSRGQSFAAADDLRHGGPQDHPWPDLPKRFALVHVHGVPLRKHLRHPFAFRAYERLAPLGPNDGGGILLRDLLHLPGILCPLWGVDHYLDPPWDTTPLLRNILVAAWQRVNRLR